MVGKRLQDPVEEIAQLAFNIRCSVVKMLAAAGSGHLGGSLSCADILATLYGAVLKKQPENPKWGGRDRFVLSIGHVAPAYYAALAHSEYFPVEELLTLRKLGSRLQGHPSRLSGLPGVDASSGSLGQGLSLGVGFALAARLGGGIWTTYVLLGDGELQEGEVWEAAMSASHHHLGNLVAIVDRNGLQIDGPNQLVMGLEPLAKRWESFGWRVLEVDGHDIEALLSALTDARPPDVPTVVIAKTVMGHGIRSIANKAEWHGKSPKPEQVDGFIHELGIAEEQRKGLYF